MMINRHNYEEFFLLYIDNELNDKERKAVEKFVSENADLAKELEGFQQATLVENKMPFLQKELLYKNEGNVSLTNYEEYFLLSVDDELSDQQSAELENFLSKNQQLQGEYELLKKTKCQPEPIAFTNKQILYRTEKQRRIVPFRLMKVSVAAAIIGLSVAAWFLYNSASLKPNQSELIVTKKSADTPFVQTPEVATSGKGLSAEKGSSASTKKEKKNVVKPAPVAADENKENIAFNKKALKKIETSVAIKTTINATEEKANAANNSTPDEPSFAQQTIPQATIGKKPIESKPVTEEADENQPVAKFANEKNGDEKNSIVSHAVYRIIDTDDEEDKNLHIGNTEINKSKLKGLFKKAASFIEKKINKSQD